MMNKQDYLKHYGIAGMKWGHRRGYDSVSPQTRRITKKLENTNLSNDKRKKLEGTLEKTKKYDKIVNDHAKSLTNGKAFATEFFLGTAHVKYSAMKKAGFSKGQAIISTLLKPRVDMVHPKTLQQRVNDRLKMDPKKAQAMIKKAEQWDKEEAAAAAKLKK